MGWNNIAIEAFCLAKEKDYKYPCGSKYPTSFCLKNGGCPYFVYSEATERDCAKFVPFGLILKDRLLAWGEKIGQSVCWIFWDSLWFNRAKTKRFFDNIEIVKDVRWDNMLEKCSDEFVSWYTGATKEGNNSG